MTTLAPNITELSFDQSHCTVEGRGLETAEVYQTAEVLLFIRQTDSQVTPHRLAAVSELSLCTMDQS